MYLKKLEILGFKSFANKTNIHFSSGITAIVGPNGCGKTNILDALRWVLGEQKVTLLRGSKMEEVIFNGTRDVKPLGMSEVTLTLVNNRGVLPTEYTEVQITRRLFRSGESEYLLNKVPCRLKDITELFYDTGVGAHSYSVIQQDMIEAVISDKAEERRFLFEEAAGITKYKQRKKAALRKLEATENDFLRLNDIYAEVKTQVNSLRRQHKKAERYQQVAEEIKAWELYLSANRVKTIDREKRELKADYDGLTNQLTEKETAIDQLSSQLEADRKEQIDIEHELSRVGNEVYEISERAHALEKEVSILREKKSNAALLIERNQNDIQALKRRSELLVEQELETSQSLEIQKGEMQVIETGLREAETVQSEADRKLLAARSDKENENRMLIELEGKLSSGRTEEDNLRNQQEELAETLSHLRNQLEQNVQRVKILDEELVVRRQEFERLGARRTESEARNTDLTKELEQLLTSSDDLSEEISSLAASIEACQARRNLLEDMILHYEGYESGVKATMEVKDRWPGVHGTVAEKFVPVEGLEVAVEAALGELAKFIICNNRPTAEAIINFLRTESKGRVGILVPDIGTLNPAVKRPELDVPGFVGWMDGFVSTEEEFKPLMQAVLSRTAVFEAGTQPDDILTRLPYGFQAVSTSGDVYSKNIISGGSDDKYPLFRRKEKVAEQQHMIEEFQTKLNDVKDNKSRVTAQIASVRAELSKLSDDMESQLEDLNAAKAGVAELEYQRRTLDGDTNRLEKDVLGIREKIEKLEHRQYTLGLDFSSLRTRQQNLVSTIAISSEQLGDLETAASAAVERVSRLQVKLVESRSLIQQTESKITHLKELQQEITNTVEAKASEIDTAGQDISAADGRILAHEENLKLTFNQRRDVTSRQTSLRTMQGDILERVTNKERQLKEVRQERDRINQSTHQLDIKLNSLESEAKSISERISDEFSTDVRTVEVKSPDENLTEPQARENLHELKERLKTFGAVNLLALEEYKTANEREQFLHEQLTDLASAKSDLQTTITKINQTARQLFLETFDKVKVNFKNLFVELFAGGEADISLMDPNDPLESDIEIIARPRGKKLISITMMSGGERALTAISLLFSLYLVKPSPFCILDEIDAPLDDANCHRFLRIIDKFSDYTQFIIITHNKISMEASHNLYGVTMEQFGISKLVAVKFNDEAAGQDMVINVDPRDLEQEVTAEAVAESSVAPPQLEPTEIEPMPEPALDSQLESAPSHADEDIPAKVVERLNQPVVPQTTQETD